MERNLLIPCAQELAAIDTEQARGGIHFRMRGPANRPELSCITCPRESILCN
jgi:hypothetical protein